MEKSRRGTEALCAAEETTTHHVLQMSLFELHSSALHLMLGQSFSSSRMSQPGIINHACADSRTGISAAGQQSVDLVPVFNEGIERFY